MHKGRLEAFSDGVIAIIITIMVLEMHAPEETTWEGLRHGVLPTFLAYVLSFIYLGIYWNNHHHMLQMTERVNGAALWANLHLLFWLSLVPFATAWTGENPGTTLPTALYGFVLLMAGVAYTILVQTLCAVPHSNSRLKDAIGDDRKGWLSMLLYLVAIAVSFASPWLADGIFVAVALMWLIPDRRIEKRIARD
jgi:TMEM175 potassium channel family protein